MLPTSRGEKLALAKEKLNKFQKTRTKTSASIVLDSAVIGTTVNGKQLSSMMSSYGGSSSNNGGERMTLSLKSASISSSPKRSVGGGNVNVLSPIKSEDSLSPGLLSNLENLKIKSAESNLRNLPLPVPPRSGSPTISQGTERERNHSAHREHDGSSWAGSEVGNSSKIQELQANNKELTEKIVLLEEAIANLKETFNSDKEALSTENKQLLSTIEQSLEVEKMKTLQDELELALSERNILDQELNATLQQLANSKNDVIETDTICNDEIESLKSQLFEYQELINFLQSGAAEAEKTIAGLQAAKDLIDEERVAATESGNNQVLMQLQQSIQKHLEVEKKLKNQIATLVCQVDKAEESDAHSQQEISRLRALVNSQTQSLTELELKLQTLEAESSEEIASLLDKIGILEAELEAKPHEADSNDPVQARVIHYRSEAESLRKENQELHDRIITLENEVSQTDSSLVQDLQNVVEAKNAEIETLLQQTRRDQQADDLKIATLHMQVEESRSHTDFHEINSVREQMEIMERDYREQIFHLNREILSLKDDVNSFSENSGMIEELQAINEFQVLELQTAQIDLENIKLQHSEEIDSLMQRLSESQDYGSNENEQLMQLQRANEDQMFELETLRLNVANLEQAQAKENEKSKSDAVALEQFYQAEMDLLNQRITELSSTAPLPPHNQNLIDSLQLENESLLILVENLKSDVSVERESHKLLLESQNHTTSLDVGATLEEVKDMKLHIANLVNTMQDLQDSHSLEIAELHNKLQIKENAPHELEAFEDLKRENKDLISEIKRLNMAELVLTRENEGLVVEIESLRMNTEEIFSRLKELQEANQALHQQIEDLQIELVAAQDGGEWNNSPNRDDSSSLAAQLADLQNEYNSKVGELTLTSDELEFFKSKLEQNQDQNILLETMRNLTDRNAELKDQLSVLQSAPVSESLEIQLQEERERVFELEDIIESNSAKYREMIGAHDQEVDSYIEKLKSLNTDIDELRVQLQESEDYSAKLIEVVDSNKNMYEQMIVDHDALVQSLQSEIEQLMKSGHVATPSAHAHADASESSDSEEVALLKERISSQLYEKEELDRNLLSIEAQLVEFKQNQGTIDAVEVFRSEAEARIHSLNEAIQERDRIISENTAFIEQLQTAPFGTSSPSNDQHIQDLEARIHSLNEAIQERDRIISENTAFIEQLQTDALLASSSSNENDTRHNTKNLELAIEKLNCEKYELELHLLQLQTENQNMSAQASNVPSDFVDFSAGGVTEVNEAQALEASLLESEELVKSLEKVIEDNQAKFQMQLADASSSKNQLLAQISDCHSTINQLQQSELSLRSEIATLKADLDTHMSDYSSLQLELEKREDLHEDVLKGKRAELEKALLELEACNLTLADVKGQLELAGLTAIQWEDYCKKTVAEQESYYQSQIAQLQSRSREYSQDAERLDDVDVSLHGAISFDTPDEDHLNWNAAQADVGLNEEMINLRQAFDRKLAEVNDCLNTISEKEKTIEAMAVQISETTSHFSMLSDSVRKVYSVILPNESVSSPDEMMENIVNHFRNLLGQQNDEVELNTLRVQLQETINSIEENALAKANLEQQIQESNYLIESEIYQKKELKARLESIESELEETKSSFESRKADHNVALSEKVDQLTSALDSEKVENARLLNSMDEMVSQLRDIREQYDQAEAKVKESNLIIEEWQLYSAAIEQQKEELLHQISLDHSSQTQLLQVRIVLLEEAENMHRAESERLSLEVQSLQQQLEESQARKIAIDNASPNATEIKERIHSLTVELEERNLDLAHLEKTLQDLQGHQEKLNESESTRSELLTELNLKKKDLEVINSRLQQLEDEMQERVKRNASVVENLESEVGILKMERQEYSIQTQQLTEERDEAYQKMTQYDEYIAGLEQEKASLLQQWEQSDNSYSQATAQNQEILQNYQNEILSLTEQLKSAFSNEATLRANLDEAIDISNSKDSFIEQYQNEILSLKQAQVKDSNEKLVTAEMTIKQMQEEFDELAILFATSSREMNELKSRFISNDSTPSSLHDTVNVTERMALNNLITALEGEKSNLMTEIKRLKSKVGANSEFEEMCQSLEAKLKSSEKKFDDAVNNGEETRLQLSSMETQAKVLEDEIHNLQSRIRESERLVSKLQANCVFAEERARNAEIDREHFLMERNRGREQFEIELSNEQIRSRDHLQFRVNELRISFDATMDELQRKQNHLEEMLDESERQLIEERTMHHQREQALVEDARYFRDSNNWIPPSPRFDFNQDRMHLDQRINDLLNENRRLQRIVDAQSNDFLKERYGLLNEISALKHDLDNILVDSANRNQPPEYDTNINRIIKQLQDQKNDLEFRLSQKDEQMTRMKELLKGGIAGNEQSLTLDRQKVALENILATREAELGHAEMKIHQLLNERDERLDESEFQNMQLKNQIRIYSGARTDQSLTELSNLQVFTSEVLIVLGAMFSKTIGLDRHFANKGSDIARIKSRCASLVQEFLSLKQFSNRLSLWRSDLVYQKRYLCLKVDDLEASSETLLEFVRRSGVNIDNSLTMHDSTLYVSPRQKWKRVFNCIIAILRMRKLSIKWKSLIEERHNVMIFSQQKQLHISPVFNNLPLSDAAALQQSTRFPLPIPTH